MTGRLRAHPLLAALLAALLVLAAAWAVELAGVKRRDVAAAMVTDGQPGPS